MELSKRTRAFLLAGFLAPAAGGCWAGVVFAIVMAASGETYQWPSTFLMLLTLTALYATLFATALTWAIGLAWHVMAYANNRRTATAYATFGAVVGLALAACIIAIARVNFAVASVPFILALVFWLTSTSVIVAIVGWLIRRPDRDAANPATAAP